MSLYTSTVIIRATIKDLKKDLVLKSKSLAIPFGGMVEGWSKSQLSTLPQKGKM